MGLNIIYKINNECFSYSISDVNVFSKIAEEGYRDDVEAIIGVPDFGEETIVKRNDLLQSIDSIIDFVEYKSEMLPYFYSFKMEVPRGSGKYSSGSGMVSGIKIDGKSYNIKGGVEICQLIHKWQSNDGEWHAESPIDVRDKNHIVTDDDSFFGDIEIYKKKYPVDLLLNIKKLKQFLVDNNEDVVVKAMI